MNTQPDRWQYTWNCVHTITTSLLKWEENKGIISHFYYFTKFVDQVEDQFWIAAATATVGQVNLCAYGWWGSWIWRNLMQFLIMPPSHQQVPGVRGFSVWSLYVFPMSVHSGYSYLLPQFKVMSLRHRSPQRWIQVWMTLRFCILPTWPGFTPLLASRSKAFLFQQW